MIIPEEQKKFYYQFRNFVYPEQVFEPSKIKYGIYSHPAEEGYIFALNFLQTFIISNYIYECEENIEIENCCFHKFLLAHNIDGTNIFDFSKDKLLEIIHICATGTSSVKEDHDVYEKLRYQITINLEFYKKYDLINELEYLSYYLFLNQDTEILNFCKKARKKFLFRIIDNLFLS